MASEKLKVEPLISHRFPIEKGVQAYEVITGKKKESFLGVLLKYSETTTDQRPQTAVQFPSTVRRLPSAVVKLGVLGAGLHANFTLLPIIKNNKDYELIGIASAGGFHAQDSGKKFGFHYATSADDEIINDKNINTVAILTRHDSHADLIIKALKAGKNVFVEKPLALNIEQLNKVEKQLRITNHELLTVGFNRRFSPHAQSLKSQISNLREPKYLHYRVNAGYITSYHWTQDPNIGGGRIIGEACHFIDLITYLVGASPISVNAVALPNNGKYSDDNVSMTFTFPDGSVGVVDYLANGDKSLPKERLEVFCEGMVAVLDDYVSLTVTKDGKKKEEKMMQDKGWRNEMSAFAKAIKEGKEPPIPYEQLIGVTKASFAAVESVRSKQIIEIK
jgi:predicted dehydrogenase